MQNIKKIFVGGSVMSGKNILWRLLDGHSEITSNIMHSSLGYIVLSDGCKQWFCRDIPGLEQNTLPFVPEFKLAYKTGEVATITIGNFFYALYNFTGYKTFHTWAKGDSVFVNMKEGETERFPFIFDIRNFENRLEETLFVGRKVFTEDEVLDVIYSSYLDSIGDTTFKERSASQDRHFADTLPNGINPIKMVAEKISSAKILIMNRDLVSLLFANSVRMQSYDSEFLISTSFRKTLFNQKRLRKETSAVS